MSKGYENLSDQKTKWEPVQVPSPVFKSAQEKQRIDSAIAENPRRQGEGLTDWFDRILAIAGVTAMANAGLPYRERDPGEEG